jgi:acetyl-CoA acetyltransferase
MAANDPVIVGISDTQYYKRGAAPKSEFALALEAIISACRDAGLDPKQLDGFASFSDDRNEPTGIQDALGIEFMRYSSMAWAGGGAGSVRALANAAAAVRTGQANYVALFRGLAQGQFGRFGQIGGYVGGLAPRVSQGVGIVGTYNGPFQVPFGVGAPVQTLGMRMMRHMYEYGTTSIQMGHVAVAARKHASRNPRALMRTPITIEDHQSSRMISEPFRLLDCCQENDGGAALIVTTRERARDLSGVPVHVLATAEGAEYGHGGTWAQADLASANFRNIGLDLFGKAGVAPADIDTAQIYDHFSGCVLMSLEDFGFCKKGEGGPFAEGGRLEWPDGELPLNTSGGHLSEVYLQGLTLQLEGVRQMRGTSTSQVKDAKLCLVTGAPAAGPSGAAILAKV